MMPFDGSGTYIPPSPPTYPPVAGTVISSTYFIQLMTDMFAALNTTFLRDGQTKMSADIDMNSYGVKALKDGTSASPALKFATDAGTGFYLNGTGKLCLSVGGVKVAEFTNGQVSLPPAAVFNALTWGATIAVDQALGPNFALTLTGATAKLNNFTNPIPGAYGIIDVTQDATGGRLLTFDTWYTIFGDPTINPAASGKTLLNYFVRSATSIYISVIR